MTVQPTTPYLRVDRHRLQRNVDHGAERAGGRRVALRPHAKTHKTTEIARLQLDAGAVGLTVATLGEAEVFAQHGCRDLFVAYPVWVDERAAARLRDLTDRATVAIGVDSVDSAVRAGRQLAPYAVEVMVEVDSGQHRTGCRPDEAGAVAVAATKAGLRVRGVFTFPGHSYAPDGRASAAADEARALATARDALLDEGLEVAVVSGGSTPSWDYLDPSVVTEARPGVYVFGDAQQWELGAMPPGSLALTCRATVVSHAGGRAVLDAGSKALGADRAAYSTGWGRLLHHPEARIVQLSEHHAVVDLAGAPLPPVGHQVDVVPNHCCATVNLADNLWVEEDGSLQPWPVAARGRNG
ncbi:MAG TPA: alanine racemase [Nocardioides bacterium]|uniref:alanine racemase n=1 Tax=uncultured Nocardioides sp. TaxID=198441 RepID=UPI000EBBA1BA|nr:alanine racemase [uncultured Nocardioides sp.]HCB04537.1 alanine racemase [Nocardioides sp.]HRD60476.1 alanine racemase [Nocardioides sp.]